MNLVFFIPKPQFIKESFIISNNNHKLSDSIVFCFLFLIFSPVFTNSERTCDKEFIIRRAATNRVLNVLRHWVSKHSQVSLHPPMSAWGPLFCWGEQVCGLIKADTFSLRSAAHSWTCKNKHMHTNTHCILLLCQLHKQLYSPESAYLLFCKTASVASNELNIKVIAWLPAYRSFQSNSIDLFYVFFFNNIKCCDDRPALAGMLPHRQAQTHTYTPTHVFPFGGQRTKSLLKLTFE